MTTQLLRPPTWASYWGEDDYGPWVSLVVRHVEQRFRFMQPDDFLMGSPENEQMREKDEVQHKVRLTEGFWLADTACSQALWQVVMMDNPSKFKGDDLPVEKVSWYDVQHFLQALNAELGTDIFRLPTEAEWEYACRAGSKTAFAFGREIDEQKVNYGGHQRQTVPVDSLYRNEWGLYQMHGNVLEWCEDWFGDYDTTESIELNPHGPDKGADRVVRGGSWVFYAQYCRSAFRDRFSPDVRDGSLGFRFASGHLVTASGRAK